jgi:LCP family protein required for cell wall assembly
VLALVPLPFLIAAALALAGPDRIGLLAHLLDPAILAAALVVQAVVLAWRVFAAGDAWRRGAGAVRSRRLVVGVVAAIVVLAPSLTGLYLTQVARDAAAAIYQTESVWHPTQKPPPDPDHDFGPSVAVPTESPAPPDSRFTVLLIGVDSGPGRSTSLTDTMIVASLDPVANTVSMVSVPRDTVDVPLPDGRVYRSKINSLAAYARLHPEQFPGAASGQAVLAAALGELLGVRIDGWAQVNLPNFVRVVDAIGGIDVSVRKGFCDAGYDEYGLNGFAITPGRYHFDGDQALAYARVRKAAGESDFTRAGRQQEIVVAVRDRVLAGGFLVDPAGFIRSLGALVSTSLSPDELIAHIEPLTKVPRDRIYRAVIEHPLVKGLLDPVRGSIQEPDIAAIRALAAGAFPAAGSDPTGVDPIPDDPGGATISTLPPVTCTVPSVTPEPTLPPTPAPTDSPAPTSDPSPEPSTTPKPGGGQPTPSPSPVATSPT